ncbi:SIMPL domain-containing protein [Sphingomonas sp. LB-2]|uniref:SIMPL domain-containing protein n=1 Tax=Sphingomonas caeni TaxID=2984949 RepID=UPI0022324CC8|nr:SIMPL domain-containing protein [Sphingomonas caeni]MCW3847578.1 SIMPL domain-containing protein [Sphingomonas caeni]
MIIRLMALLALLLPVAAFAQVAPRHTSVEIVANGEVDIPATAFLVKLDWSAKGEDEAAALKAQDEQQATVRKTLEALGVPADAITITPGTVSTGPDYGSFDVMTNATVVELPTTEDANMIDDYALAQVASASDTAIVRLTSLPQVVDVQKALAGIGVRTSGITPLLDDNDGARRQAKAKALAAARGDAEGYATVLGMRVGRVIRISEAGNGLLLPGFQDKFQRMLTSGPEAMRNMFGAEIKPGFVHVEATIIVEFELVPAGSRRP